LIKNKLKLLKTKKTIKHFNIKIQSNNPESDFEIYNKKKVNRF